MADVNLDDVKQYQKYDPAGMLARIKELPLQCRQAWDAALDFKLPAEAGVPVFVHRDYGPPAFVDAKTLLIASSYSGNTEETLSGFEPALKTGAKKIVMTTGGTLAQMAEANKVPVFKIGYKAQPRAALGFSFIPTLGVLQKLGFVKDKSGDVAETVQLLEKLSARLDEKTP